MRATLCASSDPTPAKPSNKSGRPPAETVEGRTLTKENAGQPNPSWTPSQISGTSGLHRVREADSTLRRQASEVGTVCVKRASTGLCGGCRAIGIPTATLAECGPAQLGERNG
jgi:hypothetical protein